MGYDYSVHIATSALFKPFLQARSQEQLRSAAASLDSGRVVRGADGRIINPKQIASLMIIDQLKKSADARRLGGGFKVGCQSVVLGQLRLFFGKSHF